MHFISFNENSNFASQIILYDDSELIKSHLITQDDNLSTEDCEKNFIVFLLETVKNNCKYSKTVMDMTDNLFLNNTEPSADYVFTKLFMCIVRIAVFFSFILSKFKHLSSSLGFHQNLFKFVTVTSVGCQLHQRFCILKKLLLN
ncbi:hypothetical protein CEXT_463431 [Caerostris extrusa]|uniref:Uncharacterized protein n=1 Tax=Caerostris extrusa TaxID=172846 RepID=A0AAV4V3A2_CAEEX|nr:hypothetical protein CEXT_463431 [Caerostris extrusa]